MVGYKLEFNLSDEDLEYFARVLRERRPGDGVSQDPAEVVSAIEKLMAQARESDAPPFILDKLGRLTDLVGMVRDEEWDLPDADAQRVLRTVAYFADPQDLIPDDLPVLGYLDDALMVDVAMLELEPELSAYRDFCDFRDKRKAETGTGGASRAEWLTARREELQAGMRKRRRRLFGR